MVGIQILKGLSNIIFLKKNRFWQTFLSCFVASSSLTFKMFMLLSKYWYTSVGYFRILFHGFPCYSVTNLRYIPNTWNKSTVQYQKNLKCFVLFLMFLFFLKTFCMQLSLGFYTLCVEKYKKKYVTLYNFFLKFILVFFPYVNHCKTFALVR